MLKKVPTEEKAARGAHPAQPEGSFTSRKVKPGTGSPSVNTSTPDRKQAEKFLRLLDPTTDRFTFQTFDDNDDRKDKALAKILHGTLAKNYDKLVELSKQGAGIFVTINETDLKGRKAENIKRVRHVFVDLDGAPLEPALEPKPHIVVESSPGRWHVYWGVADMPLDRFKGAQQAQIKRLNSDRTITDLPRVLRLPGFLHQKGEPFLVRIERSDEKLPVYPASKFPADKVSNREVPRFNNRPPVTEEEVRMALAVLDPNCEEPQWVRIARGVGDALGEAGFPIFHDFSRRGKKYKGERDCRNKWDHAQTGFQKVTVGTLFHLASKADPTWRGAASSSHGVSVDDFVAYSPDHYYIYKPVRETWGAAGVNANCPPMPKLKANGEPVLNKDGDPVYIKANVWIDEHHSVQQMTWAPGEPMEIRDRLIKAGVGWIDQPGVTCFNIYMPPDIVLGDANDVGPWLKHVHRVYPDDAEHIIKWCAQRVQAPQIKINHALLLGGEQGIGKDTILEPVKRAIGVWNCQEISPSDTMGNFSSYLKAVLLCINEARDLGESDRFKFYESMKTMAAAPPHVLRVNEKNLREHYIPNCVGVVITTNYKTDGIYLPRDDRRHYVAWSNYHKADFAPDYFSKLYSWYDSGGDRNVAAYLATLDISSFDPKAPPPKTAAFWAIVDSNIAPEESELASALDALNNPDAVTIAELIKAAGKNGLDEIADFLCERKNRRQIPHRMSGCGYEPVRNDANQQGVWAVGGKPQVIYVRKTLLFSDRVRAARALIKKAETEK